MVRPLERGGGGGRKREEDFKELYSILFLLTRKHYFILKTFLFVKLQELKLKTKLLLKTLGLGFYYKAPVL